MISNERDRLCYQVFDKIKTKVFRKAPYIKNPPRTVSDLMLSNDIRPSVSLSLLQEEIEKRSI